MVLLAHMGHNACCAHAASVAVLPRNSPSARTQCSAGPSHSHTTHTHILTHTHSRTHTLPHSPAHAPTPPHAGSPPLCTHSRTHTHTPTLYPHPHPPVPTPTHTHTHPRAHQEVWVLVHPLVKGEGADTQQRGNVHAAPHGLFQGYLKHKFCNNLIIDSTTEGVRMWGPTEGVRMRGLVWNARPWAP